MQKSQVQKLVDINSRGKERRWSEYKKRTNELAQIFYALADRRKSEEPVYDYYRTRASRLQACGEYLVFAVDAGNVKKLVGADFCRYRLCPMCAARRSRMQQLRLSRALTYFDLKKTRPVLLTLTVPNVPGEELRETIKRMHRAFNRLVKYKAVRSAYVGFWRSTEVTRNAETGEFHPHMHVFMLMVPGYFDKEKDIYLSQDEWCDLWKQAQKSSEPACIVDVRAIHNLEKSVIEVTKYITKVEELTTNVDIEEAADIIDLLDEQLEGLRFFGAGGELKQVLLKLYGKVVAEDDIQPEKPEISEEEDVIIERYKWSPVERAYVLEKTLTLAEYRAYAESRRACSRKRRKKSLRKIG